MGRPRKHEQWRVTYGQNWPAYNAAQTSEKATVEGLLRALCAGISQPSQQRGRPRLPISDVTFAAVMKVFTTFSGRRATSDLRDCKAKGHIESAPHSIYELGIAPTFWQ